MAYNPFTQGIKQRSATGYSRISARDLDDMIGAGLSYQSTAAAREAALRRQAEADALEKANYEAQLALDEKKHDELVNAQKDAAESSKWQGIANTAGQLGTTALALGAGDKIISGGKAIPGALKSAYQYGAGVVDNTFGTTLSQAAREAALNATIDDVLATGTAPQMSQATANLIGNTSATGLESASSLSPEIAPQMLDAGYSEALSNVGGNVTSALDSTVANTVAEKAAEQVAQQAITEGATQIAPTVSTVPSATEPIIEGGLSTGSTPLESTVGTGAAATTDVIAPTTLADAYAAGGVPGAIGNIAGTVGSVTAPLGAGYSAPALLDYIGWMPKDGVERGAGVTSAATGAGALTGALTAVGGPVGAVLGAMGGGIYGFMAGGPTKGEIQDKNWRDTASKLEEYVKVNPSYVYSSKDSPIDYNKFLGMYAKGAGYDFSDENINQLIHDGKFREVVGQLIEDQHNFAYTLYNSPDNPFAFNAMA